MKKGFTIISGDDRKRNKHQGYQIFGTLNLNNLASIIIDPEDRAEIDLGALHAKSKAERGIRFTTNRDEVPNGKPYWVVWVSFDTGEQGPYYAGITACFMAIDRETGKGFKILADHVNKMDYALKRRVMIDELDETEKKNLKQLLMSHNEQMWINASDEFKKAFD